MSAAFKRRVKRLREHVLSHNKEEPAYQQDDLTKEEIVEKLKEKGVKVLFSLLVGD